MLKPAPATHRVREPATLLPIDQRPRSGHLAPSEVVVTAGRARGGRRWRFMPERHDHDRDRTLRHGAHPRPAPPGVCRGSRAGHDGGGRTGGTSLACASGSAAVLRRNGSRPQSRAVPSARRVLTKKPAPDAYEQARLPCRSKSSPRGFPRGRGPSPWGLPPDLVFRAGQG